MSVKQLYKLYCVDEKTIVKTWTDTAPTVCPNNSIHNIELDSVRVSEKYNDIVKAIEVSEGYFETTHIVMNIPSGDPGDISEHDVTWPMDILLWKTFLTPSTDMIGDTISVLGAPETIIGTITSTVNINDTVINVNTTVTDNMWRGFLVTLDDGVNKDVLGRCIAIDSVAGTITVDTPASFSYNSGTPVKISVYILKDIYISDTKIMEIGGKGFKGKDVPSGMILRVYYTNNSGASKTFRWKPEYYNKG